MTLPECKLLVPRPGGGPSTSGNAETQGYAHPARPTPLSVGGSHRTTNGPPIPEGGRSRSFRGGEEGGSENSFPVTRTRLRSEPEKNQRINPPTSERYMSDVSLRDPTDKRVALDPAQKEDAADA